MNSSGRLFRALVTALTLLGCLWLLRQVDHNRFALPRTRTSSTVEQPAGRPGAEMPLPPSTPVDVAVPLAAMDNTCLGGRPADLSNCTGWLSGGETRAYRFAVQSAQALEFAAEPQDPGFDLSLVLLNGERECVLARDSLGAGGVEAAVAGLEPGSYELLVGGYADHCGSYLLTVRDAVVQAAQVAETSTLRGRNGTVVRWKSFAETGLSYFGLYRVSPAGRERIAVLRGHGSPAGFANYRYMDRAGHAGVRYELEAVARNGRSETVAVAS